MSREMDRGRPGGGGRPPRRRRLPDTSAPGWAGDPAGDRGSRAASRPRESTAPGPEVSPGTAGPRTPAGRGPGPGGAGISGAGSQRRGHQRRGHQRRGRRRCRGPRRRLAGPLGASRLRSLPGDDQYTDSVKTSAQQGRRGRLDQRVGARRASAAAIDCDGDRAARRRSRGLGQALQRAAGGGSLGRANAAAGRHAHPRPDLVPGPPNRLDRRIAFGAARGPASRGSTTRSARRSPRTSASWRSSRLKGVDPATGDPFEGDITAAVRRLPGEATRRRPTRPRSPSWARSRTRSRARTPT